MTTAHATSFTFMENQIEASAYHQEGQWLPEYRVVKNADDATPLKRPKILGFADRETAVLMAVEYGTYEIRCQEYEAKYARVHH